MFLAPADQSIRELVATPKLVKHHSLTLLCDSDCLPICIFKPEWSDYATFRHGHPSRASQKVSGPLKHLARSLYAPEPIVLAIDVPREQKVCLIAEPNIIKEFRFLLNLVLGSPAHHNTFCHVLWIFTLSGSFMGTDEDPWSGFSAMKRLNWKSHIFGWTFLDSFQQILSLSFHSEKIRWGWVCRYECFYLLAELVPWSCSSKFICPLINLAFQGMFVEVELPA